MIDGGDICGFCLMTPGASGGFYTLFGAGGFFGHGAVIPLVAQRFAFCLAAIGAGLSFFAGSILPAVVVGRRDGRGKGEGGGAAGAGVGHNAFGFAGRLGGNGFGKAIVFFGHSHGIVAFGYRDGVPLLLGAVKNNVGQRCTLIEGGGADGGHCGGDRNCFQGGTTGKHIHIDIFDGVRQHHGLQTGTPVERAKGQFGYRIGNYKFCQAGTLAESAKADAGQRGGKMNIGQVDTLAEGSVTDAGNAFADKHVLDLGGVFFVPDGMLIHGKVFDGAGAADDQLAVIGQEPLNIVTAGATVLKTGGVRGLDRQNKATYHQQQCQKTSKSFFHNPSSFQRHISIHRKDTTNPGGCQIGKVAISIQKWEIHIIFSFGLQYVES